MYMTEPTIINRQSLKRRYDLECDHRKFFSAAARYVSRAVEQIVQNTLMRHPICGWFGSMHKRVLHGLLNDLAEAHDTSHRAQASVDYASIHGLEPHTNE